MLASLNGRILAAAEATVPITDDGLLRGDGVFEVVRLYGGVPYALDEHLERMSDSAEGLRLPFDAEQFAQEALALLGAAAPGEATMLRMVCTRGGNRILTVEPLPAAPETLTLVTVRYSPTRVMDGIKSLSYGANMLVSRLAREQGADEALLVTPHGRVLEGPRQSFVASLDGDTLVTPPLDDHVLDSITRRRLLESGLVIERPISADELPFAQEAFLASTTREVHAVSSIDGVALPAAPGGLTQRAAAAVQELIAAAIGQPTG
jgi:branched-subunit amino acid aminotransferase/4-amino-4-deoxychorismate lyase